MKAIQIRESSPERELFIGEVPEPVCTPDGVVVEVHAAGVNRADLLQRAGKYPPPPGASPILGLEVAGVVGAVGERVQAVRPGDRVCALLSGGGYAERCVVPGGHIMKLPDNISFEEGAGLPEAFVTAFLSLFSEGGLRSGERALIHGGSSGVGTAAIQLAKLGGAEVCCTVRNKAKASACLGLGADLAILYCDEDFSKAARQWSPAVIDVILDSVGGEYVSREVPILAQGGRLVLISSAGGATGSFHVPTLMAKRAKIVGSVLRSRSAEEKAELVRAFAERYLGQFADGQLKVVVDSVFSLASAEQAHQRMQSSEHIGKLVLRVSQ